MSHFQTYCDLEFLESFYRKKPARDVLSYDDDDDRWKTIHDFLRKHTNLVVDPAEDDLRTLLEIYPFLQYHTTSNRPAGTEFLLEEGAAEAAKQKDFHEDNSHPWSLFLLGATRDSTQELSAALGAYFLDDEEVLETWSRIGKPTLLNVARKPGDGRQLTEWRDLQAFRTPLTSLVICDPYCLSSLDRARENIFRLVENLLPECPNDIPVAIMLITEEVDNRVNKLEDVHSELESFIKKQRPELSFTLSIVKAKGVKRYHDRHVFMNYGFLMSGHSFNYFNNGTIDVNTTLDFKPKLDRDLLNTAVAKLRDLADIVDRTPEKIGLYTSITGPKEHPLLEAARRALEQDTHSKQQATVH